MAEQTGEIPEKDTNVWEPMGWERTEPPSPLHDAIAAGDTGEVRRLLESGADPNARVDLYAPGIPTLPPDDDRRFRIDSGISEWIHPLTIVAMSHHDEATKRAMAILLLDANANCEETKREPYSCFLLDAALYRDPATVRLLLERGANPSSYDEQDSTALHKVLRGPDTPDAILPSDRGSDVYQREIERRRIVFRLLLEAGANPNVAYYGTTSTPLYCALYGLVDPELIRLLLQYGADPCHPDNQLPHSDSLTYYLVGAAWCCVNDPEGGAAILRLFVEAGLHPDCVDQYGSTALTEVAGHWPDFEEPFDYLAENIAKAMRALIDVGASVDYTESASGETALFAATRAGNPDAVAVLLAAGADPHRRNAEGRTVAQVAREELYPEVMARQEELLVLLPENG